MIFLYMNFILTLNFCPRNVNLWLNPYTNRNITVNSNKNYFNFSVPNPRVHTINYWTSIIKHKPRQSFEMETHDIQHNNEIMSTYKNDQNYPKNANKDHCIMEKGLKTFCKASTI